MKRFKYFVLFPAAGAAGLVLLILAAGWMVRGEVSAEPAAPDGRDLQAVRELREMEFSEPPPRLQQEVDYTKGESARWWPRGQSPILADLVAEGKLDAVHLRTGPEPIVVRGCESGEAAIGKYGGTWLRLANSPGDVGIVASRLAYANLVRWSPQGYPIVPHLAKSFRSFDRPGGDGKSEYVFSFQLRRGMRWSDGEKFTADDILYWWDKEVNEPKLYGAMPNIMKIGGKAGKVVKVGPNEVEFVFPARHGLFLAKLATAEGIAMVSCPAHYLKAYHPVSGDKGLIEQTKKARKLASDIAVYHAMKGVFNPEHPRVWPWVYRTYKANPPQVFVRNPYYCMVDPAGRQLPYIDRLLLEVKSPKMLNQAAANGAVSMQSRHINYEDYTHLMSRRAAGNYEVLHWYAGDRTTWGMNVNLNRRRDPDDPDAKRRHAVLNDKRFRQALSLAIDRKAIIRALYNDQTEPAQCAPGPASFFHEPSAYKAFTEYAPARANRLLDAAGLTGRDGEGFRTYPDGARMVFYLDVCQFGGEGPAPFVIDDWAAVGVRAILRIRNRSLYNIEQVALKHDIDTWGGNGEFMPLIQPRYFAPVYSSWYALGFAKWNLRGGLYGDPKSTGPGCIEPPVDHPLRRAAEVYEAACREVDPARQREVFREALQIAAENVWTINICTSPPALVIRTNGLRNVPRTAVYSWDFQSPGNAGIETYYFEKPYDSPGAVADIKSAVLEITPQPDSLTAVEAAGGKGGVGKIVTVMLLGIAGMFVLLVAVRHPYIGRRLLIMVPTLLIISIISFAIIEAPPGDFVTTRIMQLRESGDEADLQQIEDLKAMFRLEEPVPKRYLRWMGAYWFATGDEADEGLLQGNLGRSMESTRLVNDVVRDRVLLTVLISLGTILFTWALALPVGIYSAVKQYSVGDYVLTFIGFLGMCVPSFLLALILIYAVDVWFGIKVSGLFSPQYGAQPEWDWPKVKDLLQHVWVPVVVLGVGGTAGMIRVMRGNLLDELKKPYVVTARAKGVRPMKLLLKYPVRLALNPFISGIGGLFPMLISGGAIVAMVLNLPTVGPLMLQALQSEDTYLAGSLLMVLSLLGVLGTLVSDLLLLWLDPRIRFRGGSR